MVAIAGSYMSRQVLNSSCFYLSYVFMSMCICIAYVYVCRYSTLLSNPVVTRLGKHGLVPNSRSFHDPLVRVYECVIIFLFLSVTNAFSISFCGLMLRIVTLGPRHTWVGPICRGGAAETLSNLNPKPRT
jgi:hypothetical protein